MTFTTLAQSYLRKATTRLRVLDVLYEEHAFKDEDARSAMTDARTALQAAQRLIPLSEDGR